MAGVPLLEAYVKLKTDASALPNELKGVRSMISNSVGDISKIAGGVLAAAGIGSMIDGLKSLAGQFISTNAQLETYGTSLTVMLGSEQKAARLMADLRAMAAKTPFETSDLIRGAQTLLGVGVAAEDALPMLTKLGDAASASSAGLSAFPRLLLAVSQMIGAGRVSASDMRQISELGIPGFRILADEIGVTEGEIRKMSETGKLGAESVGVFIDALGRKYGGMMEAQSKTFTGLWSTLKDNATIAIQRIGEPLFDLAKIKLTNLTQWMDSPAFESFIQTSIPAIEQFGQSALTVMQTLFEWKGAIAAVVAGAVTIPLISKAIGGVATAATSAYSGFTALTGVVGGFVSGPLIALAGGLGLAAAAFAKATANGTSFGEEMARTIGQITGIDNAVTKLDKDVAQQADFSAISQRIDEIVNEAPAEEKKGAEIPKSAAQLARAAAEEPFQKKIDELKSLASQLEGKANGATGDDRALFLNRRGQALDAAVDINDQKLAAGSKAEQDAIAKANEEEANRQLAASFAASHGDQIRAGMANVFGAPKALAGMLGGGVEQLGQFGAMAANKMQSVLGAASMGALEKLGIDGGALEKLQEQTKNQSLIDNWVASAAKQAGVDPGSLKALLPGGGNLSALAAPGGPSVQPQQSSFVGLAEMSRRIQMGVSQRDHEAKQTNLLGQIFDKIAQGLKITEMPKVAALATK